MNVSLSACLHLNLPVCHPDSWLFSAYQPVCLFDCFLPLTLCLSLLYPTVCFCFFSAFLSIFCHSLLLSDILSLWFVWLSTCRSFPRLQYFSLKFSLLGFHDKYCMSELNSGEGVCFSPQKATIAAFRDVSSNITKE